MHTHIHTRYNVICEFMDTACTDCELLILIYGLQMRKMKGIFSWEPPNFWGSTFFFILFYLSELSHITLFSKTNKKMRKMKPKASSICCESSIYLVKRSHENVA